MEKLRYGMVGGGPESFIGDAHRKAINIDAMATLVAGCFSRTPEKCRITGEALGVAQERCYSSYADMAKAEAARREEKRAQKQQFKTITPTVNAAQVKGGVNIGATADTMHAPKTRVVDMRTSDVNLSKYDDRFNDQFFAIANGTDTKAQKQKLKKQDNKKQNVKSAKDK